jgi:hypothetical protein
LLCVGSSRVVTQRATPFRKTKSPLRQRAFVELRQI